MCFYDLFHEWKIKFVMACFDDQQGIESLKFWDLHTLLFLVVWLVSLVHILDHKSFPVQERWDKITRKSYLLNLLAGKTGQSKCHWSPTPFLLFVQIEEDELPPHAHGFLPARRSNVLWFFFLFDPHSRKKHLILMKLPEITPWDLRKKLMI